MTQIPVIDVGPLVARDAAASKAVAQEIDTACTDVGFFYVVNHGVEWRHVEDIFGAAREFFSLPLAEKAKISITDSPYHRGFGQIGAEALEEGRPGDLKEGFDMGRDLPLTHPDVVNEVMFLGPNQYPDNMAWRERMDAHYWRMLAAGLNVMRGLAIALDLPQGFFDQRFTDTVSVLRLLHYPPQDDATEDKQIGGGAHTDYGCITLLAQDPLGGLQVQPRGGDWIDATPIPESFVVNLGDLMARWTNDRWISTPHRVINVSGTDRYSIPFFCEPSPYTHVECLESCQSADNPAKYPETTSGEWLKSRFDATYAYRQ